jgi:dynein heavy chain 2
VQAAGLDDPGTWAAWAAGTAAGAADEDVPAKAAARLTPFQQLLLVKTFKPDRWEALL